MDWQRRDGYHYFMPKIFTEDANAASQIALLLLYLIKMGRAIWCVFLTCEALFDFDVVACRRACYSPAALFAPPTQKSSSAPLVRSQTFLV